MFDTQGRRRRSVLGSLFFTLALAFACHAAAFSGQGTMNVRFKAGQLSVEAVDAPLAQVLESIGRKVNTRVTILGNLSAPVTLSFSDLPLDEGIQQLLRQRLIGGYSLLFFYGEPTQGSAVGRLTEIRVAASGSSMALQGDRRSFPEALPAQPRRAGAGQTFAAPAKQNDFGARIDALQAAINRQGVYAVQALREAATDDPAPEVRLTAIRLLASMNTDDALEALREALTDQDPLVQAAATRAYARRRGLIEPPVPLKKP
jgi:hypothetical protein